MFREHSRITDDSGEDSASIQAKRASLSRMGKALEAVFFAFATMFAVVVIAYTALHVAGVAADADGSGNSGVFSPSVLFVIVAFCVVVAMFVMAALVFRDIAHGDSPFSNKQVRRIRIIAWLLFAYAVLDSAVPKGLVVEQGGNAAPLVHGQVDSEYFGVNIGLFAGAMVFFFLSSVFKYGVELQELSDEIV